jgi:hypothetical protein|uniref:hypothetical protein n=1 Tax=Sphingomonas panni TaxID=237612 RepID=UPI0037043012
MVFKDDTRSHIARSVSLIYYRLAGSGRNGNERLGFGQSGLAKTNLVRSRRLDVKDLPSPRTALRWPSNANAAGLDE